MTSRRLPAFTLLVSLAVGLLGPAPARAAEPAPAAEGEVAGEERAARDAARNEREGLTADLDLLEASEVELQAAARALAVEVRDQRSAVKDAERAVEEANADIRRAQAAIAAAEAEIVVLTDQLVERAVDSFITPTQTTFHDVAVSADLTEALRKRAFVSQLLSDDTALVDELEAVRAEVEHQKVMAEVAEAAAERRRAENEDRLGDLEAAVEEQARVEAAIEARQVEVSAEIEALAAAEAELTAAIEQAEREQREREEQARLAAEAAERERVAAEERARQQAAQERAAREQAARDEAAREQAARDQAARDQAARDEALRDRAARDAAASSAGRRSASAAPAPAAAPAPVRSGTGSGGCIWPTRGSVTSEFGSRWGRLHAGIDIAAPVGTPIYAARAGTVLVAGTQSGYGTTVVVDHGDMDTLYGHQSRLAVRAGASVDQGQLIGYVGNTGQSTGPHLHFETRYGGSPRNPRPCLP